MVRVWTACSALAAATIGFAPLAQAKPTTVWIASKTTTGCIYYQNSVVNGTVEEAAGEIDMMVHSARSRTSLETFSGVCQPGKPINGEGTLTHGVSTWTGKFVDGVADGPIKIKGIPKPIVFNMGCATDGYNGFDCTPHKVGGRVF